MNQETESNPLRKIPTNFVPPTEADIGSVLRQARMKKGQTIEAVSQHTRISKKFLEALETNRFEEFPALAYLRGFLKCYCEHLEIDFDPLWKLMFPSMAAAPKPAAQAEPSAAFPKPRASAPSKTQSFTPAALIIAAVLACALLLRLFHSDKAAPDSKAPAPPAALQPLSSPVETRLTIDFERETWVRVRVDGELKFEGRVPRGTRQDWKAKKSILLRASDPSDLKLSLNGNSYALSQPDGSGDYRIETP